MNDISVLCVGHNKLRRREIIVFEPKTYRPARAVQQAWQSVTGL